MESDPPILDAFSTFSLNDKAEADGSGSPSRQAPPPQARQRRPRMSVEERLNSVFSHLRKELNWSLKDFFQALASCNDATNTRRKATFAEAFKDPKILGCYLRRQHPWPGVREAVIDALDLGSAELRDEVQQLGSSRYFSHSPGVEVGFEALDREQLLQQIQQDAPYTMQLLRNIAKPVHNPERYNPERQAVRFDPRLILILAVLCFSQQRNTCNSFQTLLGLYLYSKGLKRRQLELLSHYGISVSHQLIIRVVKQLSERATDGLAAAGKLDSAITAYDNFEQIEGVKEQRVENQSKFYSVTTGKLVQGIEIPPGGLRQDMLSPQVKLRARDVLFAPGNMLAYDFDQKV